MFVRVIRSVVSTAILAMVVLLALLAWRGITAFGEKDLPPTMAWREADDTDMF